MSGFGAWIRKRSLNLQSINLREFVSIVAGDCVAICVEAQTILSRAASRSESGQVF
jgi:hypothetical protein